MKKEYFMMALLIPGPKAPGKEIDVYMKPLIDELNDLWINGLWTYDAYSKSSFKMHVALMWTSMTFRRMGICPGGVQKDTVLILYVKIKHHQ